MMKILRYTAITAAVLISAGILIYATSYLVDRYLFPSAPVAKCEATKASRVITIQNNTVMPAHVQADTCDTLTIKNTDDKLRRMAFGRHDQHMAYNGIIEKPLKKDESFTVTLNKSGTYLVHDHLQEEVGADFTVNE
ncbi:MAG: hypothetical protein JWL85_61 [Candidatus Saccharibacteria bacterium]|nr:hypothetical protein [Candidatus Saccharibacteria bacterium]